MMSNNLISFDELGDDDDDFKNNELDIRKLNANDSLFGRESLGILKMNDIDITFCTENESLGIINMEKLNLSTSKSNFFLSSPLNTGFLNSNMHSLPFKSNSINSEDISFNSDSLNGSEISKIYSIQSSKHISNDFLNEAFGSCSSFLRKFSNLQKTNNTKQEDESAAMKLNSLPHIDYHSSVNTIVQNEKLRKCCSEGEATNIIPARISEDYENSLFEEANKVAMRISTSFLLDENELFNIDETAPPKELDKDIISEPIDVFESVDKIVPPEIIDNQNESSFNHEDCSKHTFLINENTTAFTPKTEQRISGISNSLSKKRRSCGIQENQINEVNRIDQKSLTRSLSAGQINPNVNFGDVKKILFDLSNIISNELEEGKRREESKNLISNLAGILLSNSDDSNNNSSPDNKSPEGNKTEEFKVKNKQTTENNLEPLDLSLKCKENYKQEQKIIANPQSIVPDILIVSETITSTESESKENFKNVKKLKPKKIESGLKKGPLKAVIPIGNMAKRNGIETSNKLSETPTKRSSFLSKRTSTPIETNMKPIAQSTPEEKIDSKNLNSFSKSKKLSVQSSPLSRSTGIVRPSILAEIRGIFNKSKNVPNLSGNTSKIVHGKTLANARALSASELKRPNQPLLKRSFSMAQESRADSSKIKQNFGKARSNSSDSINSGKLSFRSSISRFSAGHVESKNKTASSSSNSKLNKK